MKKFLILLIIFQVTLTAIYYDTGLSRDFDYSWDATFICQNGYSKTATISFSNTFENIPQVFFTHETFDQYGGEAGFYLAITSVSKTSFTAEASCKKSRVFTLKLRWFAIDDQRIEVINNFNMLNPDDKTFSIKNPNAQTGFVVMTSLHFQGAIDFLLEISSITTNSVTVSITKVAGKFTNLKQIGYIVVVGIQEAFINLGLKSVTGAFSSGALVKQPNRYFAIALQGMNYLNNNTMRIRATYTNTATTTSYTWGTWTGAETPNSHSQIWILYQFTTTYKPLECFSIRTSRKQAFDLTILPTFYLQLVQTNQIYITNGNYEYSVDKSIRPLKMNIQMKCENGKKVQAEFNKCNACSIQKTYSFTYNCFNQMNYIGFFPLFQQASQEYNHLKINIQSSSLEVIHVVYDQVITEKTIVKIQILNQ
ncbi:unnamed protein product [Paramecium pentaurelia]|uniref:H-type lectin domain-containing protein n=1 Tax=Paramecium pentaurelia TaxID=43138 RepID=A0A8S1V2I5_9CILI|nr:unnamed protein product [Paramecium pentaurelia]